MGGAQPVIPPNLYVIMNIKAWGPQVMNLLVLVFVTAVFFISILPHIVSLTFTIGSKSLKYSQSCTLVITLNFNLDQSIYFNLLRS